MPQKKMILPDHPVWQKCQRTTRYAFHAPPKHAKIHKPFGTFSGDKMKAYMCVICGFVYEEAKGVPDHGLAPGTKWEDVPENWTCPDCGAPKTDFEMVEI